MSKYSRQFALLVLVGVLSATAINIDIPSIYAQEKAPNSHQVEADNLFNLGVQKKQKQEYEAALATFNQALEIYRELGDSTEDEIRQAALTGEGKTLSQLGQVYDLIRDFPQAIDYHLQSLNIALENEDTLIEAASLSNLGMSYSNLGNYSKAIEYFEKSLPLARQLGNRAGEGWILRRLANAYSPQGNYTEVIRNYQLALTIAQEDYELTSNVDQKKQHLLYQGESLVGLGNAYRSIEDYARAIEYFQQSLVITKELKNTYGESFILSSLAGAYNKLGNNKQAIIYSQEGLELARISNNLFAEVQSLQQLASAYYAQRELTTAIDYFQQALVLARQNGNRNQEAEILGSIGNSYFYLENLEQAAEYLQQSLDTAREINNPIREAFALSSLAVTYESLGDYKQLISYLHEGLTISQELGNTHLEVNILHNLGTAYYRSGNPSKSEKFYRQAMVLRESVRSKLGSNDSLKVSIADSNISTGIYQNLQLTLVQQEKTKAALEIAERGRSRAFIELLQERLSEDAGTKATVEPPTIEQIQQIAQQQNATLVEYSIVQENELYIWVIQPTGEIDFRAIDLSILDHSLSKIVRDTRNSIFSRSPKRAEVKLRKLHQLLIEPIASLLPSDPEARVIFMPQADLFFVPFPALRDASGEYLIQKHTILTSPSIQLLDLTRQKRLQIEQLGEQDSLVVGLPRNSVVVGNPIMPTLPNSSERLEPLPGAEQEAQAIAPLLDTTPILGKQATKEMIVEQMSKSRLIHLATHGLLDDIDGLGIPGALAFTGGLLTSNEIFDLRLNAELVVLSACDTGRGKITGDGVIGLSRSFITAGAASVVVSLWKVPDAPTALLMPEFYHQLANNQNKAQALRQAMLATIEKYPEPRNWAAFTLIGEAE